MDLAASISTVVTSMGGKAGWENCFRFAEKVPPRAGHFLAFCDGTCLNTSSRSALREHDVLVSSSVHMGRICFSLHIHGGDYGQGGWAGKLLHPC